MRAGSNSILDRHHRLLLRAALGEGSQAADAFRAWRKGLCLDDIDFTAFRVLPHLVETATRVDDPDLPRIRGAAKHTWIGNMLRTRALTEALAAFEQAQVQMLLIKGAALFARYPQLAALRTAGDYDILVRREDAPRAVEILSRVGFRPEIVRADLFADTDFDTIHAAHFVKDDREGSLDLHWTPLPRWQDRSFMDELFASADNATFAGREVKIPALEHHLFLAVARPALWERDEIFLRAVEITHLLRGCRGELDWDRFVELAQQFGCGGKAGAMLDLVRSDAGAPVPQEVIDRLGVALAPAVSQDVLRSIPAYARAPLQRIALTCVNGRRLLARTLRAFGQELSRFRGDAELEAVWRDYAGRDVSFVGAAPAYMHGFSFPEDSGRWTDGEVAVLALPTDAPAESQVQVRLEVTPFFPRAWRAFSFVAYGGARPAERCCVRRGHGIPATVAVPASVLSGTPRRVIIALRLIDPARPIALGLSIDPRLLGMLVHGAEVVPVQAD